MHRRFTRYGFRYFRQLWKRRWKDESLYNTEGPLKGRAGKFLRHLLLRLQPTDHSFLLLALAKALLQQKNLSIKWQPCFSQHMFVCCITGMSPGIIALHFCCLTPHYLNCCSDILSYYWVSVIIQRIVTIYIEFTFQWWKQCCITFLCPGVWTHSMTLPWILIGSEIYLHFLSLL